MKDFEKTYQARLPLLLKSFPFFKKTAYGKNLPVTEKDIQNYLSFVRALPLITSDQVKQDPHQFVHGDEKDFILLKSGGSTGVQKEFYFPPDELESNGLDEASNMLNNAASPLLVYGKWSSADSLVVEYSLKQRG